MDRVRDLVADGGVAVVLAQDRDRFTREPAYHYLLKREFEEQGPSIRAFNDSSDDSPEGELTDGILDQLAKFERAKTAEQGADAPGAANLDYHCGNPEAEKVEAQVGADSSARVA